MHRATAGGEVLADRLRPAHTHWTRLRGLLGTTRLAPGEGLWIRPSNQVHMFGMRYAIDVVFLDDAGRVLRLVHALAPNSISPRVAGATSVLELPAGTLQRIALSEGDPVEITGQAEARPRIRLDAVGTLVSNLVLALLFGFFAAAQMSRAVATGEWTTTMPLVVQEALLVVLFLTRRRSIATSGRPADWIVGVAGTMLPLFMRPGDAPGPLAWLGQPLQFAGAAAAVVALGFLGRSFGIVAANRGIKTSGLYRFVRHPAYAGYLLSYVGYAISYPTPRNVLLTAITLLLLNARAIMEERLLEQDPSYEGYLRGTRWRFVPFVY
jgi:protein-S-isoprenylcysteine O-methyltransferase Ste14